MIGFNLSSYAMSIVINKSKIIKDKAQILNIPDTVVANRGGGGIFTI